MSIPVVWGDNAGAVVYDRCEKRPGTPLVFGDPVSGPARPDASLGIDRVHGHGLYDVGSQTPIPTDIGGDRPMTGPVPVECRGTVYRFQRFPAISRIRPETTATIGSVSRQSYQYVEPLTPDSRPFNAFGNPPSPSGRQNNVIMIGQTIPPALEPPRWNYTGLSTEALQDQHDTMMLRVAMQRRGL